MSKAEYTIAACKGKVAFASPSLAEQVAKDRGRGHKGLKESDHKPMAEL